MGRRNRNRKRKRSRNHDDYQDPAAGNDMGTASHVPAKRYKSEGNCMGTASLVLAKRYKSEGNCMGTISLVPAKRYKSEGNCASCVLEFDGASKPNPGQSGAGAVLWSEDRSEAYALREGVGYATNNVAEYRALILGLYTAVKKGFKHVRVVGDSKLVCMQIQGLWKVKNINLVGLCEVAMDLKDRFVSFQIKHILREYNSEADHHANCAIHLKDGETEEIDLHSVC